MSNLVQAVRGMNDILPSETYYWQYVETILRQASQSYGYSEIRFPIVEKTELFKRTIGEATDIVEKEMYTFTDRNQENLTLRPEGTAGCVRAGIEHGLLYNQIQKLWYMGPCFRHERPQKGRYRQFYQYGAEMFGMGGAESDAELILFSAKILAKLGLKPYVTLQLNSLGSLQARAHYREHLVKYLTLHQNKLDEDSQRRLTTNPLRILDSKNPDMQELIQQAPKLIDYLDTESQEHFKLLQRYLTGLGITFTLNPCLVRGLDYYSQTVFEWTTQELGAQGTVCAGGRYDGLIEQLGGKPTPALGFAMGLERIILLIRAVQPQLKPDNLHAYFITDNETAFQAALRVADELRDQIPALRLWLHCSGGSLKNQFKKADKSGAEFALILGENEVTTGTISLKSLRENTPQLTLSQTEIINYLKEKMKE